MDDVETGGEVNMECAAGVIDSVELLPRGVENLYFTLGKFLSQSVRAYGHFQ